MKDPYEVLGIPPGSGKAAARSAFRRLARQFHPDVSDAPGARERFEEARAAYEAIADEPSETLRIRPGREARQRAEADRLRAKAEQMMREHRERRQPGLREAEDKLRAAAALGPARAEAEARAVLQRFPASAAANGILGDLALMRGEREEALVYYSVAAQSSPDEPRFHQMVEHLLRDGASGPVQAVRARPDPPPSAWGLALASLAASAQFFLPSPSGPLAGLFLAGLSCGLAERLGGRVPGLRSVGSATMVRANPFAVAAVVGLASLWLGALAYLAGATLRGVGGRAGGRMLWLAAGIVGLHALVAAWRDPAEGARILLLYSGPAWAGTLLGWWAGGLARRPDAPNN